jgi:uncharacterized protein (TIGR02266 family)
MNGPVVVDQDNQKTMRFSEPVGQIRIAEWMALESRSQKLGEEERQVEEDARALEKYIRELARTPQRLRLQRPRLEQEALGIRDRRERLCRIREELEMERRVFWEKNRNENRVGMSAQVSATSEHNFYTGISGDIQEGGLFVATRENHPAGTLIDLTLSLPGHHPLRLAGEVRWVREYNEFTADLQPGLGVGFLQLSDEARGAIGAFMKSRQPLFFEME